MHQRGHVACHRGYMMDNMPRDSVVVGEWASEDGKLSFPAVTIAKFNTQVAEQCNAKLLSIRSQVAYMKQENYMSFVKYFLFKKNKQIEAKFGIK